MYWDLRLTLLKSFVGIAMCVPEPGCPNFFDALWKRGCGPTTSGEPHAAACRRMPPYAAAGHQNGGGVLVLGYCHTSGGVLSHLGGVIVTLWGGLFSHQGAGVWGFRKRGVSF